jgi:calcium/calmodulin-dependent 3',5'-cyclic nucleotide phosphodiesterase
VKPIVPLLDVTEFKLNDERDKSLDNFEFNILEVSNPTEKARLVWALLKRAGFIEDFNIPNDELSTFLRQVMKKYNHNNNPFHNFDHGVTGTQSLLSKLCNRPIRSVSWCRLLR